MSETAPSHARLALLEPRRFGRYRLHAELAAGGMARIYFATFDGPGGFVKPCVVKKIRPEVLLDEPDLKTMFLTEAKVAALLSHPNIVQAFDFGECDGEYYLALEHVEGATLADIIKKSRHLGFSMRLSATVHVGIALCEALTYAHAAKSASGEPLRLVHRDISPANVLVSTTGAVKLADFGVVKSTLNAFVSRPGVLKGKATYLSPEQARLEPLDARSDLYSLGLVLYELCTGKKPLARPSFTDSVRAAASPDIPAPSSFITPFPERLEAILTRALRIHREKRYPTADAMRADLEAFRAESGWGSATRELADLLQKLFPDGMPTSPRMPSRTLSPHLVIAPREEPPVALEDDDVVVVVDDRPERDAPRPGRWRDVAIAAVLGLLATAAFWLFVLP